MKQKHQTMRIVAFFLTIVLFSFTTAKNNSTDNLGVKGPLNFNKTNFELKWVDKPNDTYYIQEYLPKGEELETFNQMLTIHLFDIDYKLKDVVSQKVSELDKRKETDAICNYQVIESPDGKEFIVDFILGETKDDKMAIAEFNIYHYSKIDIGKKEKAIAVYAYSKRSYGDDIKNFFKMLKDDRDSRLEEMISAKKPTINIIKQ